MITESQIYSLHQKYSHGIYKKEILDLVWTHSLIVKEISLQIANILKNKYQISLDFDLLTTGALIHDLGFYKCFDDNFNKTKKYVLHGRFGYELCHQEKLLESISRFCLVHVGVGIFPNIPITVEEEIVTFADCFHSKDGSGFKSISKIKNNFKKNYPKDLPILNHFENKFGNPNLSELEKKYEPWHQKIYNWLDDINKTVI